MPGRVLAVGGLRIPLKIWGSGYLLVDNLEASYGYRVFEA